MVLWCGCIKCSPDLQRAERIFCGPELFATVVMPALPGGVCLFQPKKRRLVSNELHVAGVLVQLVPACVESVAGRSREAA